MSNTIEAIVALVQELTPADRRVLARRLRVSGLLPADELLTDQNRLGTAPALGPVATRRAAAPVAARGPTGTGTTATSTTMAAANASTLPLRMANDAARPAAPGKVVIGAPAADERAPDPHGMAPLPGQAPERPIAIIFDGGSKGNPGYGYGSYALRWPGQAEQIVQLQFGDNVTNNEAEYDTLLAAVEAVLKRLVDLDADPTTARLEIRGDSQLVINQVRGEWKCTEERLRVRRDRAQELLENFGHWQLKYHPRENSVRVLGH